MTDIKFGSLSISNLMFGTTQVQKLYLGNILIWSYTTPSEGTDAGLIIENITRTRNAGDIDDPITNYRDAGTIEE